MYHIIENIKFQYLYLQFYEKEKYIITASILESTKAACVQPEETYITCKIIFSLKNNHCDCVFLKIFSDVGKSNYQCAKMGSGAVVYPQGAEKYPDVFEKTISDITACEFIGRKNSQQKRDKVAQFKNSVWN